MIPRLGDRLARQELWSQRKEDLGLKLVECGLKGTTHPLEDAADIGTSALPLAEQPISSVGVRPAFLAEAVHGPADSGGSTFDVVYAIRGLHARNAFVACVHG